MMNRSGYLLAGVDGGGTGCRAVIANAAGERLGEATDGAANYNTNASVSIRSVGAALEAAAQEAGLPPDWRDRCVAHIGLAGIMSPTDAQRVARAMKFDAVTVSDDRITSVAGSLRDRDGMLAAIGTGTIVAGQMNGVSRFFGGWGHQLADQASGGWLGRNALRRTMLAYDGLAVHSQLTRMLMARFGDDPIEVIAFANKASPGDFASLAQKIVEAARDGDETGRALMNEGAEFLCRCIDALELEAGAMICLSGGVGPHYAPYLPKVHRDRVQPPLGTALDGALALARQALNARSELT